MVRKNWLEAYDFATDRGAPGRDDEYGFGVVNARVLTSPGHAKRIVAALADNIKKYEAQFGAIEAAQEPAEGKEMGFKA